MNRAEKPQFDLAFRKTASVFHIARLVSFVGSSFSEFAIPLFVYSKTQNFVHVGLQWAVLALTRILGGFFAPKITWFKSDKSALCSIDVILGIATLVPIFLYDRAPIVGAYICTFIMAFLTTIQNGYIDSFVGHSVENETHKDAAKTFLLGKMENGRHLGSLTGYAAAYLIAQKLGFKVAFFIDSLSFFLSAALVRRVSIEGAVNLQKKVEYAFHEFLRVPLNLLILSHMLLSCSIFLFNGSYIVTLKRDFHASDTVVTLFFMFQYFGYAVGSFLPSWYSRKYHQHIPDVFVIFSRFAFPILFYLFSISTSAWPFIAWNFFLSVLIGSSLPGTIVLYQRYVTKDKLRSLGAARIALTSVAASMGAAVSSTMIVRNDHTPIFNLAFILSMISSIVICGFWYFRNGRGGTSAP